jgi:hypothetical protein
MGHEYCVISEKAYKPILNYAYSVISETDNCDSSEACEKMLRSLSKWLPEEDQLKFITHYKEEEERRERYICENGY